MAAALGLLTTRPAATTGPTSTATRPVSGSGRRSRASPRRRHGQLANDPAELRRRLGLHRPADRSPSRSRTPTPTATATTTLVSRTWTATTTAAGTATCSAGAATRPRFYDHVADPVGARAMVVTSGKRTIAVEVVDQEGLFDVYQQRIRAQVAKRRLPPERDLHLGHPRRVGARQPGPGRREPAHLRASTTTGSTIMVEQSALAHRAGLQGAAPGAGSATPRCWSRPTCASAGPRIRSWTTSTCPCSQAVDSAGRTIVTLASVSQHAETLGFNGPATRATRRSTRRTTGSPRTGSTSSAPRSQQRLGGVGIEMAGSVGSVESPEVYPRDDLPDPAGVRRRQPPGRLPDAVQGRPGTDAAGTQHVPVGYLGETQTFGQDMASPVIAALTRRRSGTTRPRNTLWGARASICVPLQNFLFAAGAALGVFAQRPGYNNNCQRRPRRSRPTAPAGQALQVAGGRVPDRRRRVHLHPRRGVPVHLPAGLPGAAGHADPRRPRCRPG